MESRSACHCSMHSTSMLQFIEPFQLMWGVFTLCMCVCLSFCIRRPFACCKTWPASRWRSHAGQCLEPSPIPPNPLEQVRPLISCSLCFLWNNFWLFGWYNQSLWLLFTSGLFIVNVNLNSRSETPGSRSSMAAATNIPYLAKQKSVLILRAQFHHLNKFANPIWLKVGHIWATSTGWPPVLPES